MDTFLDKLAQKRNAQEMIRANTTAEAIKSEELQKQINVCNEMLQEMRKVNLKTSENAAEAQKVLKECIEKIDSIQLSQQNADENQEANQATLEEIKNLLQKQSEQSDDFLHKENVKVYRNVQASLIEELQKQTEELKAAAPKVSVANKLVFPVSILILLGVIADIVINLLNITIKF